MQLKAMQLRSMTMIKKPMGIGASGEGCSMGTLFREGNIRLGALGTKAGSSLGTLLLLKLRIGNTEMYKKDLFKTSTLTK